MVDNRQLQNSAFPSESNPDISHTSKDPHTQPFNRINFEKDESEEAAVPDTTKRLMRTEGQRREPFPLRRRSSPTAAAIVAGGDKNEYANPVLGGPH